ncbi:MAG: hypothetical protein PVH61_33485 [Candidatus Aminicenantes bacterium]|jgi:hypothetical protein
MKLSTFKKIKILTLAVLFLVPLTIQAKKVKWTVKGTVKVEHQLNELKTKFGTSPLKGIEVKVSAKSKVLGAWGTYASWGTVRTDANGKFSISKDKSTGDRKFKVQVKFQDNDLEVRHAKSTSSLTKVKWYTIVEDAQRSSGTIDFGNKIFKAGGKHDLGEFEPRRHADIWKLMQMAMERLEDMGSDFEFTTQVKIKYPHDSAMVKNDIAYANPTTKVVYIPENQFNADTILHETGHIWAYNHMSGEFCLTETLILTQNTHGLVDDHCVAFGEGFAEYWKDKMMEELFGDAPVLPYNREYLSNNLKLANLSLMQRYDKGWESVFHTLSTENLHKYDFLQANTSGTGGIYVVPRKLLSIGCQSPNIGFQNVMKVFNANSSKGYPNKLKRGETTITAFLARAESILKKMTPEFEEMYVDLVNPSKTGQPSDWLCSSPTRTKMGVVKDINKLKKSKRTSK